jgi:tetratricopeptide (TPR) repeat protein
MFNTPGKLAFFCAGLLLVVYFGFNTVSPDIHLASNTRMKNLDVTGLENLEEEYFPNLNPNQKAELGQLNKELKSATTDSAKSERLKSISGFWFRQGVYSIAGAYAKKVAELEKSEKAWQIAGTTFLYGLEDDSDPKKKKYCQKGAVHSFEQAISLNNDSPANHLNLAMAYVKLPGDDPMKGIKMMLAMESEYAEYIPLQIQLAELGIQTGQLEKAQNRLNKVLEKEPENVSANCLMAQIMEKTNQAEAAKKYQIHCK